MAPYALLFLLLATIVAKCHSEESSSMKLHKTVQVEEQLYLVDSRIMDDNNFLISEHEPIRNMSVRLKIHGSEPNSTINECSMHMGVAAMRVSRKAVVIVLYDLIGSLRAGKGFLNADVEIHLLNPHNCKHQRLLKINVEFFRREPLATSNNASDPRFAIFMHGEDYCRGHMYCRLLFNPLLDKFEPLDFNFPAEYQVLKIAPAIPSQPHGNLLVVHLIDEHKDYSMRLYKLSSNHSVPNLYKKLLTIKRTTIERRFNTSSPRYEISNDGLSYCWKRGIGSLTVNCAAFGEDGGVKLNRTYEIPGDVSLLYAAAISDQLMIAITGGDFRFLFLTKEPMVINVALVTPHSPIKHYEFKPDCVKIDAFRTRINQSTNSLDVDVLCHKQQIVSYLTLTMLL